MVLFRRPRDSERRSGFSLVEILIAAVVMMMSTIGSTVLFNQASRQGVDINTHLQEQFAISRDLATMLEINERYACDSGVCTAPLPAADASGVLPPPPDQDHYAPGDPDDDSQGRSFRQLCASGLLTGLITAIGGSNTLTDSTVVRTVSLDPASTDAAGLSIPPHRYRVVWSDASGRELRQVQLIPTVAAWCP